MEAKAAPWASWPVRLGVRAGEHWVALGVGIASVVLLAVDPWSILFAGPVLVAALLAVAPLRDRKDVWYWSESSHSDLPYWYAYRLRGSAYEDFAVLCVDMCSRNSMEQNSEARVKWLSLLYRVYSIYTNPHDPVQERTLAEMQTFMELYDH